MDAESPFGPRLLKIGIPLVTLSLVATLLLSIFGADLSPPRSHGASGFSHSALGHLAFIETLEELGITVEISRSRSGTKASEGGTLLLAEPEPTLELPGEEDWETTEISILDEFGPWTTIVVLPKRQGFPDGRNSGHISSARTRSPPEVEAVLEEIPVDVPWHLTRTPAISESLEWSGEIEGIPVIEDLQLLRPRLEITPLLECEFGVLVGVVRSDWTGPIVIVTDPDLIAHHSMHRGDNLAIAVEIVRRNLIEGEPLIVDEQFHGLGSDQGFWRRALSFPAVLISVQCVLLAILVLWGALGRFGPPVRTRVGLEAGSRRLVDSTAELLRFGEHGGSAIRKYLRLSIEGACRRLHGPETGTLAERLDWLGAREHEGQTHTIRVLAKRVERVPTRGSEESVRELALAIERWRWEIIHGVRGNAAD